jgi:hypothetical protein
MGTPVLAIPNLIGNDKHSPHAFTEAQMGRFGALSTVTAEPSPS